MPAYSAVSINNAVFAGNPVMLGVASGPSESANYVVSKWNNTTMVYEPVYSGIVFTSGSYVDVDISSLFEHLQNAAGVEKYEVRVRVGGPPFGYQEFFVYGGGISKSKMRILAAQTEDIFTSKLDKPTGNFMLTTRTDSRVIYIPENELMPMYYYSGNFLKKKFGVYVNGVSILSRDHSALADDSLENIDFAALRSAYALSSGKLANAFDIMSEGSYLFSVVITEAPRRSDYVLKFRNTYGCDEKLALGGDLQYSPEFTEQSGTLVYDDVVNELIDSPDRKKISNVFTGTIPYRTDSERLFVLDMLLSKTVTLEAFGISYPVKVEADSQLFATTAKVPVELNIKIKLLDTDMRFTPQLIVPDYSTIVTATYETIIANTAKILSN